MQGQDYSKGAMQLSIDNDLEQLPKGGLLLTLEQPSTLLLPMERTGHCHWPLIQGLGRYLDEDLQASV